MRLKRWESPRKQGRNDKGKGGTARKRQLKKRQQMLRKRLKDNRRNNDSINRQGEEKQSSPYFFTNFYTITNKIHNGDGLVKYNINYLNLKIYIIEKMSICYILYKYQNILKKYTYIGRLNTFNTFS